MLTPMLGQVPLSGVGWAQTDIIKANLLCSMAHGNRLWAKMRKLILYGGTCRDSSILPTMVAFLKMLEVICVMGSRGTATNILSIKDKENNETKMNWCI